MALIVKIDYVLLFQITGAHLSTYEALYKQVVYLNQHVIALLSVTAVMIFHLNLLGELLY